MDKTNASPAGFFKKTWAVMTLNNSQNRISRLLKHDGFAYLVLGALMVLNAAFVYTAMRREQTWICLARSQDHTGLSIHRVVYANGDVIAWAKAVTTQLLTTSPKTAESCIHEFLAVRESSNALEKKLKSQADKIKAENISTAFYPQEFHHNKDTRQVWVRGEFHIFIGGNSRPMIQKKTVVLTYRKSPVRALLLQDFNDEDTHASY